MVRRSILSLVLLLWIATGPALADGHEEPASATQSSERGVFERETMYIIGGGAWGCEDFSDTYRRTDDAVGLNASVGGRMLEHFAVEAQFEWFHDFRLQPPGSVTRSADTYAMFANLKAYPLKGRIQPYGLFGIGGLIVNSLYFPDLQGTSSNEIQSGFAIRAGAGVEVYVSDHWFISLEGSYVRPIQTVSEFDHGSAKWGIGYRF